MYLSFPPILFPFINLPKNKIVIWFSIHLGKTIGHAREKDGFYYLELLFGQNRTKNQVSLSFLFEISSTINDKIWFHHHQLGHPLFNVIKIMLPLLFKGIDVEKLHCDVCELAKHQHASFPISNQRVSIPFVLVHSDIRSPATIPNTSGSKWFLIHRWLHSSNLDLSSQTKIGCEYCISQFPQNGQNSIWSGNQEV